MTRQDEHPEPSVRLGDPVDRERLAGFADVRQWVVLEDGGLPYPVAVSVGIGEDGRLRCTGVILGALTGEPVEVTSASLREVRVAEILQQIAAAGNLLEALISFTGPGADRPFLDRLYPGLVPDLPPRVQPVRGGALPRAHFEAVASEYRRALVKNKRAPMAELRRRLGDWTGRDVPEPTARRWVQRARDMGLLGASRPGKAGEKPAKPDQP